MADDFSDFAASLESAVAESEAKSNQIDADRRGVKPGDVSKEKETKTPKTPEPQDDEDDGLGEDAFVDTSYDDAVEFPDLSQIPHPDDVEDGETEDEEGSEEEAEDTEEAEDPEAESPPFDLDAALSQINGLKTSDLRKQFLREKATKNHLDQELKIAQSKISAAEQETERLRQEYLDRETAPPSVSIEEHEPYKKVLEEYKSWKERASRRIKSADAREKLAADESALRAEGARIESLPLDQYDAARAKLEKMVESRYGSHASKVMELVDEATEYETKALVIRKEFEAESKDKTSDWARESYEKRSKQLYDTVVKNYALSDEQAQENPFALQAFVQRMMKDPKTGDRVTKIFRDDVNLIHKTIQGPPPLKIDPTWSDVEKVEAQQLHAEESRKFAKHREETMPALMQDGLWARRAIPMLMKGLNELQGLKKKVKPTPTPRRPGNKSAPKENVDERERARKELDKALGLIG